MVCYVSRLKALIIIVLVLLIAAIAGLPFIVKQIAERKLPAYLAASGLEASWETMGLGWGDRVTLENVRLHEAAHDVSVSVERLVVRIALRSLFSETPRIQGVLLEGVNVGIDLASLKAEGDEPGEVQQNGAGEGTSGGRLRRAFEQLPDVELKNVTLSVNNAGKKLGDVRASRVALEAVDKLWRLEAKGGFTLDSAAFGAGSVAGSVAGIGAPQVEGLVVGTLDPFGRVVSAQVRNEEADKALVDWQVPGFGGVQLQTANVELSAAGPSSVVMENFRLHLEGANEPGETAVEVLLPSARAVYQADSRLYFRARNPHLAVMPGELSGVQQRVLERIAGLRGADDSEEGTSEGGEGTSLRSKITAMLWLASLDVQGATAEILAKDGKKPVQEAAFVESLTIAARGGRFVARGHVLGGDTFVDARFVPGEKIPQAARVMVRGVELSMLPGTTRGLGEPSRGIRGSVGGKIDLNLVMQSPHVGPRTAYSRARVYVSGSADLREGVADIAGLSVEPVTDIALGMDFHLAWERALGRMTVSESVVRTGPVQARLDAKLEGWPAHPVASLDVQIAEGACQNLLSAVPAQLLGPYRRAVIEGEVAPRLKLRVPLDNPRLLSFKLTGFEEIPCSVKALKAWNSAWPAVTFAAAKAPPPQKWGALGDVFGIGDMPKKPTAVVPADLEPPVGEHRRKILSDVDWLNYPFIKQVTEGVSQDEDGVLADIKVGPGLSTYVPLADLPPYVGAAMYLTEEIMFYTNRGVSFSLMQKAIRLNLDKNRYVYGGSTVTQQLVKNLFLTRHKTLDRKLQEALIAWRIDEAVSKERVLELYVNVIEFGPDIYGIQAAAQYYFQKDARQLTPLESVYLATLKPSPWVGARYMRRKKTPEGGWWGNRMEEIFNRLVERNYLTREQADAERPYVVVWD